MKQFLIFTVACFLSVSIYAQNKTAIGLLLDSTSKTPIELASVTNLMTKKTVMTSTRGTFKIEYKDGHLLSFAAIGYYFDTLRITEKYISGSDTVIFYLKNLSGNLGDVTVTANSRWSQYQLDSMDRRRKFLASVGNSKLPVVSNSNSGAGMGVNIDYFYKKEKRKRNAFDFFDENEREEYINYRFSKKIVEQFTGFKDEALQDFMQRHRPTYEWLRKHPSEVDVKYYINDRLKADKRSSGN